MVGRRCAQILPEGRPCRAQPMRGNDHCFWHSPDTEEAAADARRLGGLRRRREKTVAGAFEFEGLGSIDSIRRLIEIAAIDALGLENSIARGRLLISAAMGAAKLLEVGELEARLAVLEAAISVDRSTDLEEDVA
jgi:hypothetical protein